jgi:hypothetical protein
MPRKPIDFEAGYDSDSAAGSPKTAPSRHLITTSDSMRRRIKSRSRRSRWRSQWIVDRWIIARIRRQRGLGLWWWISINDQRCDHNRRWVKPVLQSVNKWAKCVTSAHGYYSAWWGVLNANEMSRAANDAVLRLVEACAGLESSCGSTNWTSEPGS